MIHPIRLYGDPCLRRRARPVTSFDDALARLASELVETMLDADGAGLAAPQIGVGAAVFVMSGTAGRRDATEAPPTPDEERAAAQVVVNPRLADREGTQLALEGCLSLPGIYHEAVPRSASVRLCYQDVQGAHHERMLVGREAVVVQHESDHLEGVLFIDHLDPAERRAFMDEHRAEIAEFQRGARAHLKVLRTRRDAGRRAARDLGAPVKRRR